jgi:hypothetical protein
MESEGMVHALEIAHDLLSKDGIVIDIHPTSQPASVLFISYGNEIYLGELEESDDYIEYLQADQAVEAVVQRGIFINRQTNNFFFRTYADSLEELTDYLSAEWKDAILSPRIQEQAQKLSKKSIESGKLAIHEQISITRLDMDTSKNENHS